MRGMRPLSRISALYAHYQIPAFVDREGHTDALVTVPGVDDGHRRRGGGKLTSVPAIAPASIKKLNAY